MIDAGDRQQSRRAHGQIPDSNFIQQPLWWDDVPPRLHDTRELPSSCDVVVVGGGYAGLSTALELARHGVSVAVLEADRFGFNASARNSGGVSFGLDLAKIARWRRWTGSKGPRIAELARGALDSLTHMETFIATNEMDCDYHPRGRLVCAQTPRHHDLLARRAESLNRLFEAQAYMVSRADQHTEIGSDQFHGALVIQRSGQLHPARYLQGLLSLCEAAGVLLIDGTAAEHIARAGTGFRVVTSRGEIAASTVVVATNAHAANMPSTGFGRRIVPVASHIIVTEPLAADVAEGLLPKRRTGADNRRLLAYFRRTPDGSRFLYGSRASPFEVSPERSAAVLYRRMVGSFPQLDGTRISHAWGCRVAFTFDGVPHMGEMDGLHYLMGCNGNGVAMMNYLGFKLARKIIEGAKSTCVFDQAAFPGIPLYNGKPWFLPIAAAAYKALDRLDVMRSS